MISQSVLHWTANARQRTSAHTQTHTHTRWSVCVCVCRQAEPLHRSLWWVKTSYDIFLSQSSHSYVHSVRSLMLAFWCFRFISFVPLYFSPLRSPLAVRFAFIYVFVIILCLFACCCCTFASLCASVYVCLRTSYLAVISLDVIVVVFSDCGDCSSQFMPIL